MSSRALRRLERERDLIPENVVVATPVKKKNKKKKKKDLVTRTFEAHLNAEKVQEVDKVDKVVEVDEVDKEVSQEKGTKKTTKKATYTEEEFDRILEEFTVNEPDPDVNEPDPDNTFMEVNEMEQILYSLRGAIFDPDIEMRQRFGRQMNRHTSTSLFTQVNPQWPPFRGLSSFIRMERKSGERGTSRKSGERGNVIFEYEYGSDDLRGAFVECVQSGDPNMLVGLLQAYPVHVDAMWQLSEIMLQLGDREGHSDMLGRFLFLFESSWHAQFRPTGPAGGRQRLLWAHAPNRPFLAALMRRAEGCLGTGNSATALSLLRLLLSLDRSDPLGALYLIDHAAARKAQWRFILDVAPMPLRAEDTAIPLHDALPNWAFSRALAAYRCDDPMAGHWLRDAAERFPLLARRLLAAASVNAPPPLSLIPDVLDETHPQAPVYALVESRSAYLWKLDDVRTFLANELSDAVDLNPRFLVDDHVVLYPGLGRLCVMAGETRLLPHHIPRELDVYEDLFQNEVRPQTLGRVVEHLVGEIRHLLPWGGAIIEDANSDDE